MNTKKTYEHIFLARRDGAYIRLYNSCRHLVMRFCVPAFFNRFQMPRSAWEVYTDKRLKITLELLEEDE
jgi:hypothetical protein